jgi:hypothetical protein
MNNNILYMSYNKNYFLFCLQFKILNEIESLSIFYFFLLWNSFLTLETGRQNNRDQPCQSHYK